MNDKEQRIRGFYNDDEQQGSEADENEGLSPEEQSAMEFIKSLDEEAATSPKGQSRNPRLQRLRLFLSARRVAVILILVSIAFGWLIWPTRYRYDRMNNIPVRIDRLSGRAEGLSRIGWYPLEASESKSEALPMAKLALLDGRCSINFSIYWINCSFYNGSDWNVDRITIYLNALDVSGAQISRKYELAGSGSSLGSSEFRAQLGFAMSSARWSWGLVSATGYQPKAK